MKGLVDEIGRSLLTVQVRKSQSDDPSDLEVWVDTAFDGELVMPLSRIRALGLEKTAAVQVELADGDEVLMDAYRCTVE